MPQSQEQPSEGHVSSDHGTEAAERPSGYWSHYPEYNVLIHQLPLQQRLTEGFHWSTARAEF